MKRRHVDRSLPVCPASETHGNIYRMENGSYYCSHQDHDPLEGSDNAVSREQSQSVWTTDELDDAANEQVRKVSRPRAKKEAAMTEAEAANMPSVTDVVAQAKAKGLTLKELATKANVNLGSVYNALRAHKGGKIIYSKKFIDALTTALTD